ncbi:hypothetical protein [Streptomyces sp. NPDC048581]|uniref:hypothetical protein n=1 Tax=unclassified Streptomyces TaxID=2593676 RepID=UPI003713FC4D
MKKATEPAPERPGFWSAVGDFFSDAGEGLVDGGKTVVNDLASFGNAMIQHLGDSAGGEGLGIALDATSVGAVAGVPLNAVSAAGIATGVGLAGAGAVDLAQHAANDSAVEPLKMNSEGSGTGGSAQQEASQLIKNGQQYQGTVDDWFTNLGDDRQRIEAVTNHVELWSTFGNTPLMDDDRLGEELPQLALALGECWQGVLSTRHPDRRSPSR